MPVDYSKWDALELSDDSDIEVHPNVDKRSFIRAKQNQIHAEREQRKHQIATLKYERLINDGFMRRIQGLISKYESHKSQSNDQNADALVFQALMESADPDADQPPPRPEGVHVNAEDLPTYSKMTATLVDQVKEKLDESKEPTRFDKWLAGFKEHLARVKSLQSQLLSKLDELELQEKRKITSESIHTGFDTSYVNKATSSSTSKTGASKISQVQAVELLNPNVAVPSDPTSGADADIDEPKTKNAEDDDDDEEVEPTELGKQFSQIKTGDYKTCLQFISENPAVVAERETDGLLIMAFNAELEGKGDFARQCVHQALLLQYCRSLGRDGVQLFFKRVTTKGHQAQKVFTDDVADTYNRIRVRAKEIKAQREKEDPDEVGGVEQIQLHAVDPGTTINIRIPPKESEDEGERQARKLFEAFPPGLQRALESGSLDEVNKVLGKMSVEEAEEVVGQLGEGGMLSLEEEIIDATTEEGQAMMKELEEQERAAKEEADLKGKYADDPE